MKPKKTILVHLNEKDTKQWNAFSAKYPAIQTNLGRIRQLLDIASYPEKYVTVKDQKCQ